jgi:CheY-like chemotaxis protein
MKCSIVIYRAPNKSEPFGAFWHHTHGFVWNIISSPSAEFAVRCAKGECWPGKMTSQREARVLVVDDFASWRDQIRSLLKTRPAWTIIGEASNGQEAVEKAAEMQPDIILLDVAMPILNGIEAAKIIRQKCPKSRILFVTQDGDGDIRNAAMRLGAAGYVLKANAADELFDAIDTAMDR